MRDAPSPAIDAPDSPDGPDDVSERISTGLVGFWRFDENGGQVVSDVMPPPVGKSAMRLTIANPAAVAWVPGGLRLNERVAGGILSAKRPYLNDRVINDTGAVTLEVWVSTANVTQGTGVDQGQPNYALIFGTSATFVYRNATINQVGDRWQGRVGTLATSGNGVPAINGPAGGIVVDTPTHLTLVASATERVLYINGEPFMSDPSGIGPIQGQRPTTPPTDIWDRDYKLTIGDEVSGISDRHWLGTIWLAAAYDRALTQDEVRQNFVAGHSCNGC
ncbi:MAG: hypothetical protein KF773_01710 [Deltaproteobacteria bacterium]|nr:hypothetical protein [Deltaproteobacteria bacterium]